MCTYQDVDTTRFKVFQYLASLLRRASSRQVINPHRETTQAVTEGLEMLECQHRCRNEHRHLLRVAGSFEGSPYGNFCFSETHIATDEAVHRAGTLHIRFHLQRGFHLVGRIFIEERSLQFLLHERIRAVGKPFLLLPLGIKAYQVARNILHARLGFLLHALPCPCAERRKSWFLVTVITAVFGDFIERVDADIHNVATLINEAYLLLVAFTLFLGDTHQSCELSDTEIHMHDEVARFHLLEFFQRQRHLSCPCMFGLQVELMETVEDLMVGKETRFEFMLNKPLV